MKYLNDLEEMHEENETITWSQIIKQARNELQGVPGCERRGNLCLTLTSVSSKSSNEYLPPLKNK